MISDFGIYGGNEKIKIYRISRSARPGSRSKTHGRRRK